MATSKKSAAMIVAQSWGKENLAQPKQKFPLVLPEVAPQRPNKHVAGDTL